MEGSGRVECVGMWFYGRDMTQDRRRSIKEERGWDLWFSDGTGPGSRRPRGGVGESSVRMTGRGGRTGEVGGSKWTGVVAVPRGRVKSRGGRRDLG